MVILDDMHKKGTNNVGEEMVATTSCEWRVGKHTAGSIIVVLKVEGYTLNEGSIFY
jgi:hypothetical protein